MLTDLGSSAEMIRRGSIEGFSHGAHAVFENPAGLYRVNNVSVSAFSSKIMKEVRYLNGAFAFNPNLAIGGRIAIGYMESGVEEIVSRDKNKIKGAEYSYKSRLVQLAYQGRFHPQFHWGITGVGYFTSAHTYSATGYNVHTGIIYTLPFIEASILVRNILPMSVTFKDDNDSNYSGEEDLPLQLLFGLKYSLLDFDTLGQIKYNNKQTLVAFGLDYTPSQLNDLLTFSAGFKEFPVSDSDDSEKKTNRTYALGIGLNLFGLSLDYAYEKSNHFEYSAHQFASVDINF